MTTGIKGFLKIATIAVFLFTMIFSTNLMAADDKDKERKEKEDKNMGLLIYGGLGYGGSIFGVVSDGDTSSDLGTGAGGAIDMGAMFNYSILAVSAEFTRSSFNTMKYTESGTTYKSHGDGYYRTLTFTGGLKLFVEEGDMGYTHLFIGYRTWESERNIDYRTFGGSTIDTDIKQKISGHGFLGGFQDFSTLPLGFISIAMQSGLSVGKTPVKEYKLNGTKQNITNVKFGLMFGFEFGLGLAIEDWGLSAIAGYKGDITASTFDIGSNDYVAGAGYSQFFITVKKEFRF